MKKTLLFILAVLFAFGHAAEAQILSTCPIVFDLYQDQSGGWEGNKLRVTYTNGMGHSVTTDLTIEYEQGSHFADTLDIADETSISIVLIGTGSSDVRERTFSMRYESTGRMLYRSPSLFQNYTKTITLICANAYKNNITIGLNTKLDGQDPGTLIPGVFEGDYGDGPENVYSISGTIVAEPNPGYLFENWMFDGAVVSTSASYSYVNLDYDCEYTANFKRIDGVYVGSGEDDSPYLPGYSYYSYAISQQIYTSEEVPAGDITGISFYNAGIERIRYYQVYLSATDKSSYDYYEDDDELVSQDWESIEDATLVYDDYVTVEYGKWTTIDFDAFTLNDGENLCVTIYDYTEEGDSSEEDDEHIRGRVFDADGYQALYYFDDSEIYIDELGDYQGKAVSKKNQMVIKTNAPAPDTYTITATAQKEDGTDGGGTITGTGEYEAGETCTLTAAPASKYRFLAWYDDNDSILSFDNPLSFTVENSMNLVAKFYTNHWMVDDSPESSMTLTGTLVIDGVEQGEEHGIRFLELGAFIEDTCRASRFSIPSFGNHYKYFMLISGESRMDGKMVVFRLYDHLNGQELTPNILTSACNRTYKDNYSATDYLYKFNSMRNVTAIVVPDGAGVVTGTGLYPYNSTATLTATANNGYAFRCWKTENGDFITNDASYSFTVTENVTLIAEFDCVLTTNLDNKWTWWSTPIDVTDIDGLSMLKTSLQDNEYGIFDDPDNAPIIKNRNEYLQYNVPEADWEGELESITNEDSYKIYLKAQTGHEHDLYVTMVGSYVDPAEHPIEIRKRVSENKHGITWIGYPASVEQDANTALSGFEAVPNDVVKNKKYFAVYYVEDTISGWEGNDEFLFTPGVGYNYLSLAPDNKVLTYTIGNSKRKNVTKKDHYWISNSDEYPYNMNIIAVVDVENMEMADDNLEIGAFVNGECRGTIHLKYVERRNRYYAMLTVAGNDGDVVEFSLVDAQNNRMSTESKNVVTFTTDAVIGSFNQPFEINLGAMEAISRSDLNIFPNPVDKNTAVTLNLPVDETIREIVVTNTLGSVVADMKTSLNVMENGMPVAGIYLVKVVCNSGNVYIGKLIVR